MIKISKVELIEYGPDACEKCRLNIPRPIASFNDLQQVKQILSEVYKFGEWRQSSDNNRIFICNYVKNDIAFLLQAMIKIT
jgi:hypothetical protein